MARLGVEIDRLRKRYIAGLGDALIALDRLSSIDERFAGLDHAPTAASIDEINALANAVINERFRHRGQAGQINVAGDLIQVGDIIDSSNIAIGKEIDQSVEEGTNKSE